MKEDSEHVTERCSKSRPNREYWNLEVHLQFLPATHRDPFPAQAQSLTNNASLGVMFYTYPQS